jgi:hypothetical protein
MSVESLRSYLRLQIDRADESILNRIASIFDESEMPEVSAKNQFDLDNFLSEEEKRELLLRYEEFERGDVKGYSFEEIETYLLNKHKKVV